MYFLGIIQFGLFALSETNTLYYQIPILEVACSTGFTDRRWTRFHINWWWGVFLASLRSRLLWCDMSTIIQNFFSRSCYFLTMCWPGYEISIVTFVMSKLMLQIQRFNAEQQEIYFVDRLHMHYVEFLVVVSSVSDPQISVRIRIQIQDANRMRTRI
jgi:hypothetical protein